MGFDGVMLNEHHSTPFCMGSVMNVEAAILARITKKVKIVLLGNVLPIWDDPLFLAEELAESDMIARELLVKFQMAKSHPMVDLREAYQKFS